MSRLLVLGRTGQVATELARLAPDAIFLGRDAADLRNPEVCSAAIFARKPRAVINAAAWTAVDAAEKNEATATIINGAAPGAMAWACSMLRIPFIHLSTDYVFDGTGDAPFTPDHPTSPLGAYGRSKRDGEKAVRAWRGNYVILRTSWIFSAHGTNFLKTMLRLGAKRDSLQVVADQIGGPTPAGAIAEACLSIVDQLAEDPTKAGIYHFAGEPDTSWAGFARAIMETAGLPCEIKEIPSVAYPTPARRPMNSRLDCTSLALFGLSRPDWRRAVGPTVDAVKVKP